MKSVQHGKITSVIEVVQIDTHGFWLNITGKEYFLSHEQFPWFKDAKLSQVFHVELLHDTHLYWPELDVDLSIDIIDHPENYTLEYI